MSVSPQRITFNLFSFSNLHFSPCFSSFLFSPYGSQCSLISLLYSRLPCYMFICSPKKRNKKSRFPLLCTPCFSPVSSPPLISFPTSFFPHLTSLLPIPRLSSFHTSHLFSFPPLHFFPLSSPYFSYSFPPLLSASPIYIHVLYTVLFLFSPLPSSPVSFLLILHPFSSFLFSSLLLPLLLFSLRPSSIASHHEYLFLVCLPLSLSLSVCWFVSGMPLFICFLICFVASIFPSLLCFSYFWSQGILFIHFTSFICFSYSYYLCFSYLYYFSVCIYSSVFICIINLFILLVNFISPFFQSLTSLCLNSVSVLLAVFLSVLIYCVCLCVYVYRKRY